VLCPQKAVYSQLWKGTFSDFLPKKLDSKVFSPASGPGSFIVKTGQK
jgi:hypothetical protein